MKKFFQIKIFIFSFLLSLSILSLFTFYTLNKMSYYKDIEINSTLTLSRTFLENTINLKLSEIENTISYLSYSNEIRNKDLINFDENAKRIISKNPIINQIFLIDKNGFQYYKSSYTDTLGDRSDRDYFKESMLGRSYFSDVIISRSTKLPIIVYSMPIRFKNKINGVIGATIDLEHFSKYLTYKSKNNMYPNDSLYAFVVDKNGKIIIHPNKKYVLSSKDISNFIVVKKALNNQEGIGTYTFEKMKKRTSYSYIPKTNWGVFLQIPEKVAFESIYFLKKSIILVFLILALTSIASSYIISKYLEKPITNILNLIYNFKDGTLSNYTTSNSLGEFSVIESEFISMANKILLTQADLEEKVKERTLELDTTLNKLIESQKKIIQTEKIASLNNLIKSLSHELNTPIGISITSMSFANQLLENLISDLINNKITKDIFIQKFNEISTSIKLTETQLYKSKEILDNVSLLSRYESFEDTICISLDKFISKYKLDLTSLLNGSIHKIEIYTDAKINLPIKNPERIVQILKILISNSLKHAFLENTPGNIFINIIRNEHFLEIIYSNDGKHIPEENIEHIFEPFFKGNMGTNGIGIGLTIAYVLVEQFFNGEISCQNSLNGVEFIIKIPIDDCFL